MEEIKSKTISFRATTNDIKTIEEFKKRNQTVRRLTDADVIRHGLSLIGSKKEYSEKEYSIGFDMGVEGGDKSVAVLVSKDKDGAIEIEDMNTATPENIPNLTEEQKALGYQWLKGELCDKNGYPVEQMNGDYVRGSGGEIYATDPGRAVLKEKAKENSAAIIQATEFGKVNPAMAELLSESPKAEVIQKHAEPGMLTTQEGVDEVYDEDSFINES